METTKTWDEFIARQVEATLKQQYQSTGEAYIADHETLHEALRPWANRGHAVKCHIIRLGRGDGGCGDEYWFHAPSEKKVILVRRATRAGFEDLS